MTPRLPKPEPLRTPPGTVLVLRGDASPWDADPGWLRDTLTELHRETGHPVVFVDTSGSLDLDATTREDTEAALARALYDQTDLGDLAADAAAPGVLDALADAGWSLVRVEQ